MKKINEAKIAALQSEYETKVLEIKKKFYESIREEDLMIDSWLEDAKRRQEIKKNKARENNK